MNAPAPAILPEFAEVPDRPCECGCSTFVNFFQRGPNIGGKCRDCAKEKRWFSRFDLGLSKQERQRRGALDRSAIFARCGHRCMWCGISADRLKDHNEELVVGHVIPWRALHDLPDIVDHPANTIASCNACNDFADKIARSDWDLSMLLHAAVAYKAGLYPENRGECEDERDREPGGA